jgi:hypothetical protein
MNFIINDIEELIILNKLGVFALICGRCNSISLTNMKIGDFSKLINKDLLLLQENGLKIIEVSVDMFQFKIENKLNEFSTGDISSIYQSFKKGATLITSNNSIYNACRNLSISVIKLDDFIQSTIIDSGTVKRINSLKIIYKKQRKKII